jgi:hypothetical protein
MRLRTERYLIRSAIGRAAAAAYEWWMLFPVWLIAHGRGIPAVFEDAWPLGVVGLSLAAAFAGVWIQVRWQQLAAALAVAVGTGWLGGYGAWSAAAGVLVFAAAMQGFTVAQRYVSYAWTWTGVIVSFMASIAVHAVPSWKTLEFPVLAGGILNLATAFYDWNHRYLKDVSMAGENERRVPAELTRPNRLYLTVLIVAVLALAAGVGGWITGMIGWMLSEVRKLLLLLFGRSKAVEIQPTPEPLPPPPFQPQPQASEPGLFAKIFNVLVHLLAYTIMAALIGWGLWVLYRNRRRIWQALMRVLAMLLGGRTNPARQPHGFTDEESSLFSWEETLARLRKTRIGRMLSGKREPRFEDMSGNREKARFLYRRWLRVQADHGYRVRGDLTPSETARDVERWRIADDSSTRNPSLTAQDDQALIDLYYRVRYRDEEPTDDQVAAIRRSQEGAR